jgi:anti-sigma factor RsiW
MLCKEMQNRILEYEENQLSATQREETETHLAGCRECREFARELEQLDAALAASVKVRVLSAEFDQRLRERIEEMPALSEAERAERKRQLTEEFEAGLARIGRGSLAWSNLLRHLAWPAMAVTAGWLAWCFTPQLMAHINAQSLGGVAASVVPWLAASAVFLAVGLAEAFPRRWKLFGGW